MQYGGSNTGITYNIGISLLPLPKCGRNLRAHTSFLLEHASSQVHQ